YAWTEDNSKVTAIRICANDPTHVEAEIVNTTSAITKDPTCDTKGETTYTAEFSNPAFAVQSKTVENIDALGHDWGAPVYEWTTDNSKVTATRVCGRDDKHKETETVKTTSKVTKKATINAEGEKTYTAEFENEAFETQTATTAVPKLEVVTIYRLYNPNTKEHLWTASKKEYDTLPGTGYGWKQEGIAWYAPKPDKAGGETATWGGDATVKGVYRLFNKKTGDHHYTSDLHETEVLTTQYGWVYDNNAKPLFYSGGDIPIYRLYNKSFVRGSHHFTKSKKEYDTLPDYGWRQEGIAFRAAK
ncbi:MAG: hypothetical protein IIY73_03905, partial [Solobacterium sp.]|nr:hypothetical protein [Solobacterium sp.]